jgi:hypothetical protein
MMWILLEESDDTATEARKVPRSSPLYKLNKLNRSMIQA